MLASFPSATVSCNVSPDSPWYPLRLPLHLPLRFPPLFLLHKSVLIKNRWLGEKYDGIRVCWHPDHQKLYHFSCYLFILSFSYLLLLFFFFVFLFFQFLILIIYARTGSELDVYDSVTDWFADDFLDGEVWYIPPILSFTIFHFSQLLIFPLIFLLCISPFLIFSINT